MRSTIALDNLVQEAFRYVPTAIKTQKELIDFVLREFIQNHRSYNLRELQGKVSLASDYDYKTLRNH